MDFLPMIEKLGQMCLVCESCYPPHANLVFFLACLLTLIGYTLYTRICSVGSSFPLLTIFGYHDTGCAMADVCVHDDSNDYYLFRCRYFLLVLL